MSTNQIDLFELFENGMPSGAEDLNDKKLAKLQGYAFSMNELQGQVVTELNALKTPQKKKEFVTKNIAMQTTRNYEWFLNQIANRKHPYQVFLNRLTDGLTPSADPLAAYNVLLDCWKQKEGDHEAIEAFSNETKTKTWIKEKTPSPSEEKINGYLVTLSETLNNVKNPFGLIPLVLRKDDPEFMIAYMRWCLQQGKTPKEIIHSGLLQLFFISNFGLQGPESTFGQMYALMSQYGDLKPIYDQANTIRAAPMQGMSEDLLRDIKCALTGTTLIIPDSPSGFSNCNNPTLSLPEEHDPKAYLELFGLGYVMVELMRVYPRYGTKLTSVLSLLSVQELIECLAEVGPLLSEEALNKIPQFITIDKIPSLIEKRNWIAFRFISNQVVVSFFNSKSSDQIQELIDVIKSQHNIDAYLLMIELFDYNGLITAETNWSVINERKEQIYFAVLDEVLNQGTNNPKLSQFLISKKYLFPIKIAEKIQSYHQQLIDLEKSIPSTGLTQEFVNALQDVWSGCLSSYNRLKDLKLTQIDHRFPASKYDLWIRIIKLQQTTLQAEFDLESTLKLLFQGRNLSDLTSNEKSELQRLLAEFVVSIDDPNCQQDMMTQIDRLIISNQLESTWAREALVLAAKVGRIALIEKLIERDQLTQQKITEAFILLVEGGGGEVGLVKKFLNLPENIQPSQQAVEKSFQLAIKCPTNLIASALLLHKGDNQLSQQTVRNYLFAIVREKTEVSLQILDTLLNMNGDNKPDTALLGDALVLATRSGNSEGVEKILTKKQGSISKAFIHTAFGYAVSDNSEASLQILDTLLNMNGDNKPDTALLGDALVLATRSGNSEVVEKILNKRQGSISKALIHTAFGYAVSDNEVSVCTKFLQNCPYINLHTIDLISLVTANTQEKDLKVLLTEVSQITKENIKEAFKYAIKSDNMHACIMLFKIVPKIVDLGAMLINEASYGANDNVWSIEWNILDINQLAFIEITLSLALSTIHANNPTIMSELLKITGNYQLRQSQVNRVLTWALDHKNLHIIYQILALDAVNKLDQAKLDFKLEQELQKPNPPNTKILIALLGGNIQEDGVLTRSDTTELADVIKNMHAPQEQQHSLSLFIQTMLNIKKMLDAGCPPKLVGGYLFRNNENDHNMNDLSESLVANKNEDLKRSLICIANCLTTLGFSETDMPWSSKLTEQPRATLGTCLLSLIFGGRTDNNPSHNSKAPFSNGPKK